MRIRRSLRTSGLITGLVLALSLLVPAAPVAAASCAEIKFFGVHGTNEKGPDEDTAGDKYAGGAGPKVWKIWLRFAESNAKPRRPAKRGRRPRVDGDGGDGGAAEHP
jgi:hypothetical protein